MEIILRNGDRAEFDRNRITRAIKKALEACDMPSDVIALSVTEDVVSSIGIVESVDQEAVQDLIEDMLMKRGLWKVAKAFIKYRDRHAMIRNSNTELVNGVMDRLSAKAVTKNNANVDECSFGGRTGEAISYVTKRLALDFKMSEISKNNHENNTVYIHDLDQWIVGSHNCLSIPFDKLLKDGFVTRQTDVRGAQSISTAFQLMAVIFQLQSLQQFGGVSSTHLDFTMVPFVRKSFRKHYLRRALEEYMNDRILQDKEPSKEMDSILWRFPSKQTWYSVDDEHLEQIEKTFNQWYMEVMDITDADFKFYSTKLNATLRTYAMQDTRKEAYQAVEAFIHNLNTLQSRSGNQLPFTSINVGTCTEPEGRMITELLLKGYMAGTGKKSSTPRFPCFIFVSKKGINRRQGDPNYDLFQKAIECTAKRIYPNYGNGDWSSQRQWLQMDRDMKREIIDSLPDDDRQKLLTLVSDNPELGYKLTLLVKDGKLDIDPTERPYEQFSTMGALAGQEHLYVKLGDNIYDMPIRALYTYCKDGVLKEARPCQIFFNKDELRNPANRRQQSKSGIAVGAGVYAVTYLPEDVTYIGSSANVNRRLTEHRSLIKRAGKLDAGPCFGDSDLTHYRFEVLEYTDNYEEAEARYIETVPNVNYRGVTHQYYKVPSQANGDVLERPNFKADLTKKQDLIDLQDKDIKVLDRDNRWVKVRHIFKNDKFNTPNMMHVYYMQQGKTYHLACTEDHPLWTGSTFTEASKLTPGDHLYRADGLELTVTKTAWFYDRQDSYDIGTETGTFIGSDIIMHNCRTANGFDVNSASCYKQAVQEALETGEVTTDLLSGAQKDGRGNICPVTIILPELAMIANGDEDTFMQLLDQKIHEAKDTLLERFNWICSQPASSAVFMYDNHTMCGYKEAEGIRSALQHGTIVIGQVGLAETLQILIGKDHTTTEGMELAKKIEGLFAERCTEFKKQYHLNFGVYYSPAESLCHTALVKFREKYGVIPNVSDKEFFTNSMHVPVWIRMNPFEKADIESQLTGYSSAGCISYYEFDIGIRNNPEALEKLILYTMEKDIPYVGGNTPNDHCEACGYLGEIPDKCPKCGSTDIVRLRRVTGYISVDYHQFNIGKQDEVEHRRKHIG